MTKSAPFLLFDGNCAEVMSFYKSCIGGELQLTKLGDTPMNEQAPPEMHERVIFANLKNGDIDISAADWMVPEVKPLVGNIFAIYITGQTVEELRPMFDALKDGDNNHNLQELQEMPFGTLGQFFDKYETQWIFMAAK